jgi:hypothetical protein
MDSRQYRQLSTDPNSRYNQFFTEGNIDFVYNSIIAEVKKVCPDKPLTSVPRDIIDTTMWEIFDKEYNHPQIMLQRIINILSNQVIGEYQAEDFNNSLDPHILQYDQAFGIVAYDPQSIKLNHRKYNNIDYTIRR